MKYPSIILSLCLLTGVGQAWGKPYYVAPTGDDANPGSLEKPFATLQRAQQAVRQTPGPVYLRGGTYYLPESLVFTPQDSGTKDVPVVYQAWQNECPVISGGVGWTIWTGSLTAMVFS